jgi:hypothetical protein
MIEGHMAVTPFLRSVRDALEAAELKGAEEISQLPESEHFGNMEATFRVGSLLIKFVRDRLQAFVDLGSTSSPTKFHQFDDVEIAMGWKTIDQVLAKKEPEDLTSVLKKVSANFAALEAAFSADQEQLTRARVERAARERGEEFEARLRPKKR